jgi:hypothetical protein
MQRDYVLRMIEQAAAVLRAVLARLMRREADASNVAPDLERAAHLGGFDLNLLLVCDLPSVLPMLAPGGEPEPGRTWLAAEVLFLHGLTAHRVGDAGTAVSSFEKARLLFGLLEPTAVLPTGFPEATERLREIEAYLHEYDVDASAMDKGGS